MRPDLVSLAKKVHEMYRPSCTCALNGEDRWHSAVKCARKTLLQQAETLINQLSRLGYSNKEIAKEAKCNPSTTSQAHVGGADLQLGLAKLLDLVQSLQLALEDARKQHFSMSIRAEENIVRPLDPCSSTTVTGELMNKAASAIYSNVCSILLARPAEERRSLPDGIEGIISDLGDPRYGISVIQVEPTDELERLKRQLHEIKHYEERLEHKIRRLESDKKLREKRKPPRARFS